MTTRELFRAENLPVFQNKIFDSEQEAVSCPTGDVVLVQNMQTGLIYNATFDSGLLSYDGEYQNEQAHSSVFQSHLESVAEIIRRHCHHKAILEIGCGKGYFLDYLRSLGYDATGIDPAYEGDSPHVAKARFESSLGLKCDFIVLRHVLEHVWNPVGFLAEIADANSCVGTIYIEVPCFDWICRNRAWFDIFYEHVNYFRLDDLIGMFTAVHEAGHLFGGQYLYIVANLASLRASRYCSPVEFPSDFLAGLASAVALTSTATRRAVWGAAAKGMMFALYMKRLGTPIDFAVDINPAKQGKYLAGSGLQVLSPSQAFEVMADGDSIFIMNSNYADEIVASAGSRYRYLLVDHLEIPNGS